MAPIIATRAVVVKYLDFKKFLLSFENNLVIMEIIEIAIMRL